ncbi:glycoside hydrolase N-terminal domain-containing protein [Flavobacterium sp. FlaQc-48]|uniref:glycoside hydrolase N-terminal domain-containing protein n=1 Tax=Flavobacterium sp. FlaQc-48 TaxID=3374181 RepID=UPI0037565A84
MSIVVVFPLRAQYTENILRYDTPGNNWFEALPLGNGRLGAMLYGQPVNQTLQLNEQTIWAGGPYRNDNTSMPSYEEVAAESKSVSAVLEQSTGDFAALVLIKGFRFKVALMEEHFNENYMESEKYSKATFKGKFEDFDVSKITAAGKTFVLKGNLNIHGKTKNVSVTVKASKTANGVLLNGSFDVKPEDFDIEIPSMVRRKIADKIKISYNFLLIK